MGNTLCVETSGPKEPSRTRLPEDRGLPEHSNSVRWAQAVSTMALRVLETTASYCSSGKKLSGGDRQDGGKEDALTKGNKREHSL